MRVRSYLSELRTRARTRLHGGRPVHVDHDTTLDEVEAYLDDHGGPFVYGVETESGTWAESGSSHEASRFLEDLDASRGGSARYELDVLETGTGTTLTATTIYGEADTPAHLRGRPALLRRPVEVTVYTGPAADPVGDG